MSWIEHWRGLHWNPPGNLGWLFVLLSIAAVAYAVVVYRRTDAPLGTGMRSTLTALRALALLTLVAILCRPVLTLAVPGGARQGVLVLLDRSRSISLPGRHPPETRDQELARSAEGIRSELQSLYPLTWRGFDRGLGPVVADGELPPPVGEVTDPASALEQGFQQGLSEGRPGVILLVSDGTQTDGPDPVPVARRLGIPVETIALGSADPVPDLAVVRIRTNREAFLGERTPVQVALRLQGLQAVSVRVQLVDVTDGETALTGADVALQPTGAEHRLTLRFTPSRPGLRFLEVRVPSLPGEATAADNRRMVAIEVREEKAGVLLLSGSLTWDHTFVRRALDEDSTLAVTSGTWRRGAFRPLAKTGSLPPLTASGLRGIRTILLDHVCADQLDAGVRRTLVGFVRGGGGLLVIAGSGAKSLGSWGGTELEPLLPVRIAGRAAPEATQAQLTAAGRRHVLFDPSVPGAPPLEVWKDLPPLAVCPRVGPLKAGAEVLMTGSGQAGRTPLLSWMQVGRGRVVLLGGGGIWKWSFSDGARAGAEGALAGWWRRAVHWLARPDVETRLDIRPREYVVARGKPVTFVARVTDEAYRPIPDAAVEVTVSPRRQADGKPQVFALSGESGLLSGVVEGLAPGRYRYEGRARSADRALGMVEGAFAVDSVGTEMERLEADPEVLSRIARATGGRLWEPDSMAGLGEEIRTASRSEEERYQVAVWDHPLFFVAFVIFVSLEWLLRRRQGLV